MSAPLRLAVIGDPIAHSLSPRLHALFSQHTGVAVDYNAVRVQERELGSFVGRARKEMRGFNITMPHKQAIIPYLDCLSDSARDCGAVNTVVCHNGRLEGHNTDGSGFILSLSRAGVKPHSALILGAGGAATAVARALWRQGVRVTMATRRCAEASEDGSCTRVPWREIAARAADCDLLVNATPLGMTGKPPFPELAFLNALPDHAFVSDLVYEPRDTQLVRAARERGLRAQDGLPMLVCQAAEAFMLFTGVRPGDSAIDDCFRLWG